MADKSGDLARLGLVVAASIEAQGAAASAGIVRQMARRLVELEQMAGSTESGCAGCGAPLSQVAMGRPRKWCGRGVCVAQRGRKTREKSIVM